MGYPAPMPTRVLLTVDTELTWRHYVRGNSWQENFAWSYDPAGVGVPYVLDRLATYGLKACFFLDPMPALVYGLEPIRRMVEPILAAGQEIQLHLHSFWVSLSEGVSEGANFELTCFDGARQRELIQTARDLLVRAGAPNPIAFRSGSFAADDRTFEALRSVGIRYDSSHNGSHHPWPSSLSFDPRLIVPVEHDGVVEVPVSQITQRGGGVRHLQLCAVSSAEMRAALLHACAEGHPLVTLVSHSFELASRDGLRPNRTVCRRFEALCRFLRDNSDRLSTTRFAELHDLPLGRAAEPLPPQPLRTLRRMAEQLWANAIYERTL